MQNPDSVRSELDRFIQWKPRAINTWPHMYPRPQKNHHQLHDLNKALPGGHKDSQAIIEEEGGCQSDPYKTSHQTSSDQYNNTRETGRSWWGVRQIQNLPYEDGGKDSPSEGWPWKKDVSPNPIQ